MRRPRKNAWCSKHEPLTVELVLFGVKRVVTAAASEIASLLGVPWERVKKRRQRGWSWNEAIFSENRRAKFSGVLN